MAKHANYIFRSLKKYKEMPTIVLGYLKRKRKNIMIDIMEKELPACCKFTDPEGGLFTWIELPEGIDAKELAMKCLEEKVAFVTGSGFYPNGGHENTLRLNYSNMPEEKITEGMKKLCKIITQFCEEKT